MRNVITEYKKDGNIGKYLHSTPHLFLFSRYLKHVSCSKITFFSLFPDKAESANADKFLRDIAECWHSVSKEIHCAQSTLEVVISSWKRYKSLSSDLEQWIDEANTKLHLPEEEKEIFFQVKIILLELMNFTYLFIFY